MANGESIETVFVSIEADFSKMLDGADKELEKAKDAAAKIGKTTDKAADSVGELGDEISKTGKKTKEWTQAAIKAEDATEGVGDAAAKSEKSVKGLGSVFSSAVKSVVNFFSRTSSGADKAGKASGRARDKLGRFIKVSEKAGDKGGASILKMGAAFGLAAGAASKLLDAVVNLATSAVQMLKGLASEAIQLASDFEQVQMTFTNIFKDEAQANKFLADLRVEATKLGISFNDASQFAKSIFPDTKNAEEFNRILKNAAIGAADAGLPLRELIFSFNEAVAGDFVSIRDRLDIPKEVIERIKAAPDTVSALNEELEKLFAKRGVDNLEAMSSTFDGLKRQISGFREGLLGIAGAKILEPLREGLQSIVDIIKEYGPSLDHVAEQFGEIIAMVVDFARGEVTENVFDPTLVFRMVEGLKSAVEWLRGTVEAFLGAVRAAKAFGTQVASYQSSFEPIFKLIRSGVATVSAAFLKLFTTVHPVGILFKTLGERIKNAGGFFGALNKAFITAAQMTAILSAAISGLIAFFSPLIEAAAAGATALWKFATLDFAGAMEAGKEGIKAIKDGLFDAEGGAAAFEDSMLESAKSIDAMSNPLKEVTEDVKGLDKAVSDAADTIEAKPLLDPAQLEKFGDQLAEAVEDRAKQQAKLEQETAEKITKIVGDANQKRLDIDKEFNDDLADLAQDSEEKRIKVIEGTRQALAELEQSTDRELSSRRKEFNKGELRQTEDHLKEMRRLQEDFLFNLDDAVRSRDAGAIVDLQRQFQKESSQREEGFSTNQNRQGQDFSAELDGIRKNEASRRDELITAQAQSLDDINKFEEEKRNDLEATREEEQEKLKQDLVEKLQLEDDNFIARQAALDEALQKQLESIAKNLADQKDITEEGAREILETFDQFFGIGGDIDKLMEDFARKRKIRADITVAFQGATSTPEPQTPAEAIASGGSFGGRKRLGGVQEFATGGTLIASKPTLALFGEKGPEVVQFTPMSELSSPEQSEPGRMIIELTGSAPPGVGAGERDAIAAVLLTALQDSGALN